MSAMTEERRRRVREVFIRIAELPQAERPVALTRECGNDGALQAEVEALLSAHDKASAVGFMSDPTRSVAASAAGSAASTASLAEKPGTRIGPFKLLQQIGEGGFGVVFMADQDQPVRRRVALKIIKMGMDTKQVVARFEQERQALALMDHPNIAKVLDAGATETGRPYFVMEYVVGDRITAFADAHRLSVRDRLDLFAQVCTAIQHAHQKGIIHRDLKPNNVLVSMVDGKPFAKVIDFGIAKATGARLTDKTLFTEHRQLIGTPEYMSPEQAEGSADIDTRTDVYALGVLLYELLTGATPFDAERLRSAAFGEMQRIIKEEEPPAPSLRLSRDLSTLAAAAAARNIEPGRLGTVVKGELDWIVMRALEKDRARRYESPSSLSEDVERHLSGEPVVAAPPSASYRIRKLVRKHRRSVVTAGVLVATLVMGIAGTTVAMWRARLSEAQLAQQVTKAEDAMSAVNQAAEIAVGKGGAGLFDQVERFPDLPYPGVTVERDAQGKLISWTGRPLPDTVEEVRDVAIWYIHFSARVNTELEAANTELREQAAAVEEVLSRALVASGVATSNVASVSGGTVRLPGNRVGRLEFIVATGADGSMGVSPRVVAEWAAGEGDPPIYESIEKAKLVMLAEVAVSSAQRARERAAELDTVNKELEERGAELSNAYSHLSRVLFELMGAMLQRFSPGDGDRSFVAVLDSLKARLPDNTTDSRCGSCALAAFEGLAIGSQFRHEWTGAETWDPRVEAATELVIVWNDATFGATGFVVGQLTSLAMIQRNTGRIESALESIARAEAAAVQLRIGEDEDWRSVTAAISDLRSWFDMEPQVLREGHAKFSEMRAQLNTRNAVGSEISRLESSDPELARACRKYFDLWKSDG